MSIFAGTKLFNRELRLNNRSANKSNNNENHQIRGQVSGAPPPILPNIPISHQYQMQNPFTNNALRGAGDNNHHRGMPNMMPTTSIPQLQFPPSTQLDYATLLAQSAQMLSFVNGLGSNNGGDDDKNGSHKHQSKMMHRNEHRSHNQNSNYSRDKDRRNDRRRNHSRSKSPDRLEWIRNQGRDNKSDRHGRDRNNRNDNNRRRNDKRF